MVNILLTTGQTTLDVLKRYVESQGNDKDRNNKIDVNKMHKESCKMCGW